MAIILLMLSAAFAADPMCTDPSGDVEHALRLLKSLDLAGARAMLDRAESGLACSPQASPALLGELWMVEGLFDVLAGKPEAAVDPFRAAARVAPGRFDEAFGEESKRIYTESSAPVEGQATLAVAPALGSAWQLVVDGVAVEGSTATVVPGLHSVQVTQKQGPASFAQVVLVQAGESTSLEHGLPARPPRPKPTAFGALHLAAGADVAGGEKLSVLNQGEALNEPSAKVVVPLELGVQGGYGPAWLRVNADLGALLNGRYVYQGDGEPASSAFALGGALAGGVTLGPASVGVLYGLSDPSRMKLRLLGNFSLADSLGLEVRAGVNLATEGRVEPAGGLMLTYQPVLAGKRG